MADRFQNIKMVQKLKCKSLFLHGKKDRLIPYTQSEGSLFNFSYLLFYI